MRKIMFFIIFILYFLVEMINPAYISPYKYSAFDISNPYVNHTNLDIQLTFSVKDISIPSSVYLIIIFDNATDYFLNGDMGTLKNCILVPFTEIEGAHFNAETDLLLNSSDQGPENQISTCGTSSPYFYFKLNKTISEDLVYELTFTMSSAFVSPDSTKNSTFLSYIGVYFFSTLATDGSAFTYAANIVFSLFGAKGQEPPAPSMYLTRERIYYDTLFYAKLNKALNETCLSLNEAKLKQTDIGVAAINMMLKDIETFHIVTYDTNVYPNDIIEYPGFFGNLMLDILISIDLLEFTRFEITIPKGWILENSNCISLNYTLINAEGKSQNIDSIPHSKCQIGENSQKIVFYNILKISNNTYIRVNITNVRNPVVPMTGMTTIMIFHEDSKMIKLENTQIGLLAVTTKNNIKISLKNMISDIIQSNSSFILNKTQQIQMRLTLDYYDILKESKIVISQNSSNNTFGFKEGTCVIINDQYGLKGLDSVPIECTIDKAGKTMTITNILSIYSNKYFSIYFLNDNEETMSPVQIQVDIFVKNLNNSDFSSVASVSNIAYMNLQMESIRINNAYYQFSNGTKTLDLLEVSSVDGNSFKMEFTLPANYTYQNSNYFSLVLNNWIDGSESALQCNLNGISVTNCTYIANLDNNNIDIINLTGLPSNLLPNSNVILEIKGLSYNSIAFNSYKYVFEYYLICFSGNSNYSSFISANISPQLNLNPDNSQILIIGQGNKTLVGTSLLQLKLSSDKYSYYTSLAMSTSKVRVYFKNLDESKLVNFGAFPIDLPMDSGINAYYVTGSLPSSDTYTDWSRYEIANIPDSYLSNIITIPFNTKNDQNPVIYVVYYIMSSSDGETSDFFDFAYDYFKKESISMDQVETPDSLDIDWNSMKDYNEGDLTIRSNNDFLFFINISSSIFVKFYNKTEKNGLSGYILYILPWINQDTELGCMFQNNQFSEISAQIINDNSQTRSILWLTADMSSLTSTSDSGGFSDYIQCSSLTIPSTLTPPSISAYITDYNGGLLGSTNLTIPGGFSFSPAKLNLQRLLVSPNNIEFPAAHYAFYFTNDIDILEDDVIGTYLDNSQYGIIPSTNISCYISYIPSDYTIPASGDCFNFDEIEYQADPLPNFNPAASEITKLQASECLILPDGNSLYVALQLNLNENIPANSLLLFEIFGITNPSKTEFHADVSVFRTNFNNDFEAIMVTSPNFIHILYDFQYEISASLDITPEITPYHINGLFHFPLLFEITLPDINLINFVISLNFSSNLISANNANKANTVFVKIENSDTDIYYLDIVNYNYLDEDYFNDTSSATDSSSDTTTRLLDDGSTSDSSTGTSTDGTSTTNSTSTDGTSTDETNSTSTDTSSTDGNSTDTTSTDTTSSDGSSTDGSSADGSETSSDGSIEANTIDDGTMSDTSIDDLLTDSTTSSSSSSSSGFISVDDTSSDVAQANNQKTYREPIISRFEQTNEIIKLTIGQPSLSQKLLTVGMYLFKMLDDDNDVGATLTISVRDKVLYTEDKSFSYFNGTNTGNLTAVQKNNDISLETQRSNFTVSLTTDFDIKGDKQIIMIVFDGEFSVPVPEAEIWINGNLMSSYYEDKFLIGIMPIILANTEFQLDIANYLYSPSISDENCYISIVCLANEEDIPKLAQSIIKVNTSQSISTDSVLMINEINSTLNTFSSVSIGLNFMSFNVEPSINSFFRLMLPFDFPPNYFIDKQSIICTLILQDSHIIIANSCQMKGIYIDIPINKDSELTDFSNVNYFLRVDNIYTTNSYGTCGDLGLFLINSTNYVTAINFKLWDYYINPILIQSKSLILKSVDKTNSVASNHITLFKGTIKRIYLITSENGFRNSMTVSISISGNSGIAILTPLINITSGDISSSFVLSVSTTSLNVLAFVHFTKKESIVNKYEEIYPLEVDVSLEKIPITVPDQTAIYPGGNTYFLDIGTADDLNINITISITTSHTDLTIIGSNIIILSPSNNVGKFRLSLNSKGNETSYQVNYAMSGSYSNFFKLSSNSTDIKTATANNLTPKNLTFTCKLKVYSRSIAFVIKNFKDAIYIYYQVYEKTSNNLLELNSTQLRNKLDKSSISQIVEDNMTSGIIFCNDTSTPCVGNVDNLQLRNYYLKCVAVYPTGIESETIYKFEFQPFPIKPFVLTLGTSYQLSSSGYNDLLCCLVDFFAINPNDLYLSDNSMTCNSTLFNSSHSNRILQSISSQATTSIKMSQEYISTISSTLTEMGVNTDKLQNLDTTTITKLVASFTSLSDFEKESSQNNIKLYIYPPASQPDFNLSIYSNMIAKESKMAYFRSKYSFLSYDIYLKVAGVLGSDGDLQDIMPIFVGQPVVRIDDKAISLIVEVSNEAIVYAIAILVANASQPNGTQVALGVDGLGKKAAGVTSVKTTVDSEENYRPINLQFHNLTNNKTYYIYYVTGLNVPRDPLVSNTVYYVKATPQNPLIVNNRRILSVDEEII